VLISKKGFVKIILVQYPYCSMVGTDFVRLFNRRTAVAIFVIISVLVVLVLQQVPVRVGADVDEAVYAVAYAPISAVVSSPVSEGSGEGEGCCTRKNRFPGFGALDCHGTAENAMQSSTTKPGNRPHYVGEILHESTPKVVGTEITWDFRTVFVMESLAHMSLLG
jgi:hypothetical protein